MIKSGFQLTQRRSPLSETLAMGQTRKSSGGKKHFGKELALALPLTSLIDAFSIIVIYLLIGTQSSGIDTKLPGNMTLPMASFAQIVDKTISTLRIEKGQYFLDEQPVAKTSLAQKLTELKKASKETNIELMVQADQQMDYADLDPLLKAGSEAGIEKLRFAVIPTK